MHTTQTGDSAVPFSDEDGFVPCDTPSAILRALPNDLEAERMVIGSMLLDPAVSPRLAQMLSPGDFYRTQHGRIFGIMAGIALRGDATVPPVVFTEIERAAASGEVDWRAMLADCAAMVSAPANAEHYARRILQKAAARELIALSMRVQRNAYDGLTDPAEEISAVIAEAKQLDARYASAQEPTMVFRNPDELSSSSTDVSWVWRGYLARGAITLFVAQPKAGKSTLLYAMLAALGRGDAEFAGARLYGPAKAVYLSEESAPTIREKVSRFGIATDTVWFLTREEAFPPRPLRLVTEAAVEQARRVGATILVVDTLAIWAHLGPDAEKDAGAMQRALEPLLAASGAGLAVLVIHHMRKADGDGGTSVRGSSALLGTVDCLMELRRFNNGSDDSGAPKTERVISAMGRYEETPDEVVVRLNGGRYELAGTAAEARIDLKAARLLQALQEAGRWLSAREMQEVVGGRKEDTLRALAGLTLEGKVRRIQVGRATMHGLPGLPTPPGYTELPPGKQEE